MANSSDKARREGKVDQVTGKAKEKVGQATGDERMESRGRAEHLGGRLRERAGRAVRNAKSRAKEIVGRSQKKGARATGKE